MKIYRMIIFFTIVLGIYTIANVYLFYKGFNAIPEFRNSRITYIFIFSVLALTFIAGKFLEVRNSSVVSDILNITGGFWMGFMLYSILLLGLADIILIILRLTGFTEPEKIILFRKWSYISTVSITVLLIIAGFINAVIPVVKRYEISINKKAGEISNLRIAAVSDIHLGSVIRKRSMIKLSDMLEKEDPDIVFLLGDIVDGDIGPVLRGDLLQYFKCPVCKDGLYAITGNHEFIGGPSRTIPYIESKGIRLLKDEVVTIEGGIQLIGRLDRDSRGFGGKERLSLDRLMEMVDTSKPVILLDHQPFNIAETVNHGVDLQLSGHTHNGQMWPLNFVTRLIYEVSYGYRKTGNTNLIVSSGYGLWGPRIRLGSRSEIVVVDIRFSDEGQPR